jgi:hypothetical protein
VPRRSCPIAPNHEFPGLAFRPCSISPAAVTQPSLWTSSFARPAPASSLPVVPIHRPAQLRLRFFLLAAPPLEPINNLPGIGIEPLFTWTPQCPAPPSLGRLSLVQRSSFHRDGSLNKLTGVTLPHDTRVQDFSNSIGIRDLLLIFFSIPDQSSFDRPSQRISVTPRYRLVCLVVKSVMESTKHKTEQIQDREVRARKSISPLEQSFWRRAR